MIEIRERKIIESNLAYCVMNDDKRPFNDSDDFNASKSRNPEQSLD